jgi:hypothetical protein
MCGLKGYEGIDLQAAFPGLWSNRPGCQVGGGGLGMPAMCPCRSAPRICTPAARPPEGRDKSEGRLCITIPPHSFPLLLPHSPFLIQQSCIRGSPDLLWHVADRSNVRLKITAFSEDSGRPCHISCG